MAIDTGSTSVHVGKSDQGYIEELGWENLGVSKIFSRALKRAALLEDLREEKRQEINKLERKYDL